jgi:hypothetical protein
MSRTLEIQTTVLPGHRIEICSPELPEGSTAQVRVTVNEPADTDSDRVQHPSPEAERLYWKDLPELLQTKRGRWVCYTAQGCVAEGPDWDSVFRECKQRGLQRGQFLIWRVEPDISVIEMSGNWFPADSSEGS